MTDPGAALATAADVTPSALVLVRRPPPPRLWLGYGLAIVLTLGVLLPILAVLWALAWWLDDAPARFDGEGLTTRRARRVLWREITSSSVLAEHRRRGGRLERVRWYVRLEAGPRRLHFQPELHTNGAAGLAWLERSLGTTFVPPD